MTNKEIVKAWIVVIKNKRMPTEYLINVTIDRINSLTAEVLRQQAEINVKKRLLDKAEAEIEELKTSNFQFISNINAYKAENERLKTNLNIELENYATEYDNKIKAEAYREFAERLKEDAYDVVLFGEVVTIYTINKILKRLVGDDE